MVSGVGSAVPWSLVRSRVLYLFLAFSLFGCLVWRQVDELWSYVKSFSRLFLIILHFFLFLIYKLVNPGPGRILFCYLCSPLICGTIFVL